MSGETSGVREGDEERTVCRRVSASRAARDAARHAFNLSEVRYRAGVDRLIALLNAQQTLYQAEDDLAQTRFARLQALVGLYRARGGGWQDHEATHATAANVRDG